MPLCPGGAFGVQTASCLPLMDGLLLLLLLLLGRVGAACMHGPESQVHGACQGDPGEWEGSGWACLPGETGEAMEDLPFPPAPGTSFRLGPVLCSGRGGAQNAFMLVSSLVKWRAFS